MNQASTSFTFWECKLKQWDSIHSYWTDKNWEVRWHRALVGMWMPKFESCWWNAIGCNRFENSRHHQPRLAPTAARGVTATQCAGSFLCSAPPCAVHPALLSADMVARLPMQVRHSCTPGMNRDCVRQFPAQVFPCQLYVFSLPRTPAMEIGPGWKKTRSRSPAHKGSTCNRRQQ